MPYDGNGNFIRAHNWTADAANALDINATEMDQEDNGIAAGLSNAVTRDGQGKMGVDFLPNADNTLNLGSGAKRWASLNGTPISTIIPTQQGIGGLIWPVTATETAAGVTPTTFAFPPGYSGRYTNLQQMINGQGTTGYATITPDYVGTDTYNNPNGIPVLDLRGLQFGVWSVIGASLNVQSGSGTFPEGNDLVMRVSGPADLYMERLVVATTTAASLSIGANASVLVGAVVARNFRGSVRTGTTSKLSTNTGVGLTIARGQANEEFVTAGNWSIVDGTHLSITCTKVHSGTTDIEQIGSTILATRDLKIGSNLTKATQESVNPRMRLMDATNVPLAYLPSDTSAAFPNNSVGYATPITGENGANGDLIYQARTASALFRFRSTTGSVVATLNNSGDLFLAGSVGFNGGSPAGKPTVTGSRGGNVALASLLTALSSLGILTDSSTV